MNNLVLLPLVGRRVVLSFQSLPSQSFVVPLHAPFFRFPSRRPPTTTPPPHPYFPADKRLRIFSSVAVASRTWSFALVEFFWVSPSCSWSVFLDAVPPFASYDRCDGLFSRLVRPMSASLFFPWMSSLSSDTTKAGARLRHFLAFDSRGVPPYLSWR